MAEDILLITRSLISITYSFSTICVVEEIYVVIPEHGRCSGLILWVIREITVTVAARHGLPQA